MQYDTKTDMTRKVLFEKYNEEHFFNFVYNYIVNYIPENITKDIELSSEQIIDSFEEAKEELSDILRDFAENDISKKEEQNFLFKYTLEVSVEMIALGSRGMWDNSPPATFDVEKTLNTTRQNQGLLINKLIERVEK